MARTETKKKRRQKQYRKHPVSWWSATRIDIARLLAEGHTASHITKMRDAEGNKLFSSTGEVYDVKKAFDRGDTPFDTPSAVEVVTGEKAPEGQAAEEALLEGEVLEENAAPEALQQKRLGRPPKSTEDKPPVVPQGPVFTGQVRPRIVILDERLFLLYDLARIVFPEYQSTEGEWIFECITHLYMEHSEEMELSRLFPNIKMESQTIEREEISDARSRTEQTEVRAAIAEEAVYPV